jgi:hypothetical protein
MNYIKIFMTYKTMYTNNFMYYLCITYVRLCITYTNISFIPSIMY